MQQQTFELEGASMNNKRYIDSEGFPMKTCMLRTGAGSALLNLIKKLVVRNEHVKYAKVKNMGINIIYE